MVPKDLDIEFEDESEEQERLKREADAKKRKETLHTNADLEFSVPGMDAGSPAAGTASPAQAAPQKPQGTNPQARPGQAQPQGGARPAAAQNVTQMPVRKAAPNSDGQPQAQAPASNGIDYASSSRSYSETEVHALIRAAVAECKLEMIAEIAGETKELEIKVTRMLGALGAKAPPLKKEFLQIQKMVQDHTKLSLKLVASSDKKKAA